MASTRSSAVGAQLARLPSVALTAPRSVRADPFSDVNVPPRYSVEPYRASACTDPPVALPLHVGTDPSVPIAATP